MSKLLGLVVAFVVTLMVSCSNLQRGRFYSYGKVHRKSFESGSTYKRTIYPTTRISQPRGKVEGLRKTVYPKRKLIYSYTNPIRVKKVNKPSEHLLTKQRVFSKNLVAIPNRSINSFRTLPDSPVNFDRQFSRYRVNNQHFPRKYQSSSWPFYPIRPSVATNFNSYRVSTSDNRKSVHRVYHSPKIRKINTINRIDFDSKRYPVPSIDDPNQSTLSKIVPPPGFRAVLVNKNGKFPINRVHSRSGAQIQNPIRVNKRTPNHYSPARVLRFEVASMREARALLGQLGSGFKVTVMNVTKKSQSKTIELPQSSTTITATTVSQRTSPTTGSTDVPVPITSIAPALEKKRKHWWKGDHVCTQGTPGLFGLSEKIWERIKTSKTCSEKKRKYVCIERFGFGKQAPTKTTTLRCCAGYRINSNRQICQRRFLHKTIGSKKSLTNKVNRQHRPGAVLTRGSSKAENLTIFMPSDDVVKTVFDAVGSVKTRSGLQVQDFLENHVISGRALLKSEMENNLILKALSGNSNRVNIYRFGSNTTMTVNCRKVTTPDVINDNTVIHFIEEIIERVDGNIFDYLHRHSRNFSNFLSVLENAELTNKLRQDNGSYTVFAPINSAFHQPLFTKEVCADSFVRNHVINDVFCAAAFENEKLNLTSLEDEGKLVYKNEDQTYVDEARIVSRDIVTSNGVIHVIDSLMKPSAVSTVYDVLKSDRHFSIALNLFQAANITEALATKRNFSVIVPSNLAFRDFSRKKMNFLKENEENLQSRLMFHLLPVRLELGSLHPNTKIETLRPPLAIYVTRYPLKPRLATKFGKKRVVRKTVTSLQCVPITKQSRKTPCNGAIFVVKKLLQPPSGSVLSTMMYSTKHNFSILLLAIRKTGLERIMDGQHAITLFAPTNFAFSKLPSRVLKRLMRNKQALTRILKFHVITGFHCKHELLQRSVRRRTLLHSAVLTSPKKRRVYLGRNRRRLRSKIVGSDIVATNGVVHAIDNLLIPIF